MTVVMRTMQPDELRLRWSGPFRMRDFFSDEDLEKRFSCRGVYLWIEKVNDIERLSYVGKAGGSPTLSERQRQHYANTIGGLYAIPREFRAAAHDDWSVNWSRRDVYEVLLDPARFHALVNDAFSHVNAREVYLACLRSAGEAKRVERQLIYDLQPTGTRWGRNSPPGDPVTVVHEHARWASDAIKNQLAGRNIRFA